MIQEFQSNQYENQIDFQEIDTRKLNEELSSLESSVIIELFEVDTAKYGGKIYRFHSGRVIIGDVVFDGKTYNAYPIEVEDFEVRGDGSLARPKMTFANVDGFMSNIINGKDDFVGLKITRIRTFLKYIDEINFIDNINPFGSPDPTAKFPNETYFINQKIVEDKHAVQFELASELELEGVKLPARTVYANFCPWIYRGRGCHYGDKDIFPKSSWVYPKSDQAYGLPIADSNNNHFMGDSYNFSTAGNASWQSSSETPFVESGFYDKTGIYVSGDYVTISSAESDDVTLYFIAKPTGIMATKIGEPTSDIGYYNVSGQDPRYDLDNWVQDQCSKNLSGCLLRFAHTTKGLPYGGFPGTERFSYG